MGSTFPVRYPRAFWMPLVLVGPFVLFMALVVFQETVLRSVGATAGLVGAIGLMWWLIAPARYEVGEDDLLFSRGVSQRLSFPLAALAEVRLSTQDGMRLLVVSSRGDDGIDQVRMIAPADAAGLLQALAERVPGLRLDGEVLRPIEKD